MQPYDTVSVSIPGVNSGTFFSDVFNHLGVWGPMLYTYAQETFGFIIGLCFPVSLFLLIGIVYSVERLKVLRKKEALLYEAKVEEAFESVQEAGDTVEAHQWSNVVKHIESPHENDWKQALIEADIILDDLLTRMGYRGSSVGEKLKRVEPGDFKTLQDAWNGHTVRNKIAHEAGFTLNKVEAQQAFHSYKKVFEEFYFV